jgi:hypothetical protein
MSVGTSAKSNDSRAELDVCLDGPVGAALPQFSEGGLLERGSSLVAGSAKSQVLDCFAEAERGAFRHDSRRDRYRGNEDRADSRNYQAVGNRLPVAVGIEHAGVVVEGQ